MAGCHVWPTRACRPRSAVVPRVNAEAPEPGQHKEGSANMQLSIRGRVCPGRPSEPNHRRRGARETRTKPSSHGQLVRCDVALHMTDVVVIAWPPDRYPSSTRSVQRVDHCRRSHFDVTGKGTTSSSGRWFPHVRPHTCFPVRSVSGSISGQTDIGRETSRATRLPMPYSDPAITWRGAFPALEVLAWSTGLHGPYRLRWCALLRL